VYFFPHHRPGNSVNIPLLLTLEKLFSSARSNADPLILPAVNPAAATMNCACQGEDRCPAAASPLRQTPVTVKPATNDTSRSHRSGTHLAWSTPLNRLDEALCATGCSVRAQGEGTLTCAGSRVFPEVFYHMLMYCLVVNSRVFNELHTTERVSKYTQTFRFIGRVS